MGKGGWNPFSKKAVIGSQEVTKQGAKNRMYKTSVRDDTLFRYVIPQTFFMKQVEQVRIPSFYVKTNALSNHPFKATLQRKKNNFIDYIVEITFDYHGQRVTEMCAIMRLYGWTNFNRGVFAGLTNPNLFLYLKKGVVQFKEKRDGNEIADVDILLDSTQWEEKKDKTYLLQDDDTVFYELKADAFESLRDLKNGKGSTKDKDSIAKFKIMYQRLERFRNIELVKNQAKQEVAEDVAEGVFEGAIDIMAR